jgi:alpha-galactosidase
LHLLRGIPRQAVEQNTPILHTSLHASDIANINDVCTWNPDMYGVDMTKPGAQEYYDSVLELLASWDLDFLKVDDLSRPYHKAEIEAIRKAIDKTNRPIVLSTSPGETPLVDGAHVALHANMWRISDDFWDEWKLLKEQFARVDGWTPFRGLGHFPDADMLPVGNIRAFDQNGWTRFTHDEQITMMTLWCIARSPLIIGGNLPKNDEFTLSLLTNDEVLAVDQNSSGNRQLFRTDDLICWVADVPNSADKYVAMFNAKDRPQGSDTKTKSVTVKLKDLGFQLASVRNLWLGKDEGSVVNSFSAELPYHGAGLYRFSPK